MAVNTNARKNPSSTEAVNELTEEEVAAMAGSDYMNETQTAFFRGKLSRLKQEMLDSPTGALDFVRDEPLVVPDPVDRATVQEEKTLELNARDGNHAFLEKIDQSLARIEAGEYGYYQETRKPGNQETRKPGNPLESGV